MSANRKFSEESFKRLTGLEGTQQCDGCAHESRRPVPQGHGHRDDCGECFRHCACFKDTMGAGWR